ncbi:antitoxin Xre-like helix-turn-helix domain-containing protein [Amaricoccus sp.]|uniref:antitoxin Xre-like helix-turn-helix domain-containing protein n=1 Tax=Amaricoccus sp. TaxID=1872485 RepID=UPI001B3EEDF5|nr:antitoxin Xre-like helix-turn-helix domain-containing protein [Amaricoccus sp.]MBP7243436.1 DUF2384 domain-containing protein [Amaricoccus sp.]
MAQPLYAAHVADDPEADARVALTALRRVAAAWRLTGDEAAGLAGVSTRTWARMKTPGWAGRLGQDQMLRASGLVGLYKALHLYFSDELADAWPKRPNAGRMFGGHAPVARMLAGGLPAILATRGYVDALRGGA